MTDLQHDEYDRRFAGVAKIYGETFSYYEQSHVMVIGLVV
jgi:tRNA A37 threonylcarbamoyladenosine dehydratase